ncbi:HAD-IA family hydrolase [Acuticoccus sp. I52.16.1]|uniref:HAD-IA family hydrolase n=1 Tax=Acuticoccus sp. I52.16.1 TaxID=2928472 RepID=UPI001FD46560|nr:HAD-IA family hydrolase [Acuticoccus sp. I52.16.1]UOM33672.1 HAD-IA family hydrolase [Acuticoccus sp. I52.16.1]
MTLRLVLFDCDGTLVDSAAVIVSAMQGAFVLEGLPPPSDAEVRAIIGLSLPRAVGVLAARHPEAPVDVLVASYKAAYRDQALATTGNEPTFPGTHEAIAAIHREDTLLGVVTGKSRRGLERVLAEHGLAERFAVTVTADDAASKPAPDMVLNALAATGAAAASTVVVGDTVFDIEMGLSAGAAAIGVDWGYHATADLEAAGAHAIARSMEELPHLVDEVLRKVAS